MGKINDIIETIRKLASEEISLESLIHPNKNYVVFQNGNEYQIEGNRYTADEYAAWKQDKYPARIIIMKHDQVSAPIGTDPDKFFNRPKLDDPQPRNTRLSRREAKRMAKMQKVIQPVRETSVMPSQPQLTMIAGGGTGSYQELKERFMVDRPNSLGDLDELLNIYIR
jgi:hypothetical protein